MIPDTRTVPRGTPVRIFWPGCGIAIVLDDIPDSLDMATLDGLHLAAHEREVEQIQAARRARAAEAELDRIRA